MIRSYPSWSAPGDDAIEAVRQASVDDAFSYGEVGGTRSPPLPAGWTVDEDSVVVGRGAGTFERAAAAIREWRMFDLPWVRMPDRTPPTEGRTVAFATRQLGLWAIHTCRVVYVRDEPPDSALGREAHRFGFAYGTLATHAVAGEERFEVTFDPGKDLVTFSILKFSALRHPLVRAVRPAARAAQRRFSREAVSALARAVAAR